MTEEIKHLYKSRKNKVWAGVIGGVAEYFNVDASILRLAYILLMFISGFFPLFFAYMVAIFIIPQAPNSN
jgi:phage shock protein C